MYLQSFDQVSFRGFKTVLLLGLLLICVHANAQHGYRSGYVIKNPGDTLHGFIKAVKSKRASQLCRFKVAVTDTTTYSYSPDELTAYRFTGGKFFISKKSNRDSKSNKVFMEYLIKGKANVYYFRDTNGDHYFIEKEGGELTELTEPVRYFQAEGGKNYKAQPKYKGKLLYALSDCDSLSPKILKTRLTYSSLIDLAEEYHERVCTTEKCIIYAKPKNKIGVSHTFLAGYTINRYNFGDQLITNFGPGIQIGILTEMKNILFSDERLGINVGVLLEQDFAFTLSKHKKVDTDYYEWTTVTYRGNNYIIDSDDTDPEAKNVKSLPVNLSVTALKIPIMFNYRFSLTKSSVNLGVGLSNRFTLRYNREFKIDIIEDAKGKSINMYSVGPAVSLTFTHQLKDAKELIFNLTGSYHTDLNAGYQYQRLEIAQFSFRVGYMW